MRAIQQQSSAVSPETVKALRNLDVLWQEIDKARAMVVDDVLPARPEGGITIEEYAEQYGLTRSRARTELLRMTKIGKMTMSRAMIPNAIGHVVVSNVFTLNP